MQTTLLDRWKMGDPTVLNLAEFYPQTTALGPGKRAVIWVQGCAQRCPGCIAPTYRPFVPANIIPVEHLAAQILNNSTIEGITISGGEPFHQAPGLAMLINLLHANRPELTVISYSGFLLSQIKNAPFPGAADYLSRLDVLIDGPYVRKLDNGRTGLRGSTNQVIHHLTQRIKHFDFENTIRQPEIHIHNHELVFIGVPSASFRNALDQAMDSINSYEQRLVQDVRP